MTTLVLPGPLDPHVHLRDLDWAHKGTIASETAAALAGGYWAVIDMPNTPPSTTDLGRLEAKVRLVGVDARCDVGLHLGAGEGSWADGFDARALELVLGLKLYLDATTGDLLLRSPGEHERLIRSWRAAGDRPLLVHAEGRTLVEVLSLARRVGVRVHVCHVSSREEVALVRNAKEGGQRVTAGVTPHHLFLTDADVTGLGAFARVRPPIGTVADRDALWAGIADRTIDLVESDHAPHTREEKASAEPPHGVPGLETTLPLLGLAVHEGRLTPDRLVELVCVAPQRIFRLAPPAGTTTTMDLAASWVVEDGALLTACGWSPFAGMRVRGRIREVRIRGRVAWDGERVVAVPGDGRLLEAA